MKNFILLILMSCFLLACSNIEYSYNKDELNNQLYNKTNINITGDEIPFLNTIVLSKFGISQNEFLDLEINISEKKTKMVIKTNQVSTRIDYEIVINYILSNQSKKCTILTKKQYSRFSFIPKSEGYNFGSDKFLDNLYIRNIENNIDQFLDSLDKQIEKRKCINEN
jgi:hypothetical protein